MKPLIGITIDSQGQPDNERTLGKLSLNWNYAEVIAQAGGLPMLIPPSADMEEVARRIDGWLIPGGADIDAARFGEPNHPKADLQDPSRFEAEERLYRSLDPDTPVLGICYGCQFLNIVRGGSLIQHLPDEVGHERHTGGTVEELALTGGKLAAIAPKATGRSYHHQAVGRVGAGLEVTAKAEDGTVEALEASDRPWMLAVQWHPERSLDDPLNKRLFEEFVAAARRYREAKG
ncbi:MAG: gamma-glutamyl-gamma-aminobutyrate hydrolase family protein [Fimbriimonas ginsengisoli]|uniref:Gamma-glutamyl-gamma-aminobutyrate hydrolase family protein n=1 Tax=Fimbriimonas ginsengisoli TaxID=1005039 RepID=A0A931LTN3_FIMGI|nr:gamma-glutamyl-gamma-aminobutyrate hydrolase family protein [Fimbriimonas ginsengisoli]